MKDNPKIVIVMPAYNAAKTVEKTYNAIPTQFQKHIILIDDCSKDETVLVAKKLGIKVIRHEQNKGYGGNQKTCYKEALSMGADIVVLLHPDYQYAPELITAMVAMITSGIYDVVLASRILTGDAKHSDMPRYKYISNRILTNLENWLTGAKLSEYHTGYRAFSRRVLENIDLSQNSDDFIFDNQMILQTMAKKMKLGEISCPTKYFDEASSINFSRSLRYGLGCLWWGFVYFLGRIDIYKSKLIYQ